MLMRPHRLIQCPRRLVIDTIRHLQDAGTQASERILLWLAEPAQTRLLVKDIVVPVQTASADRFYIPPVSMKEIMATLADRRLMIAAQVHSHPQEAFHSPADDRWAIVRHTGALSLVLPYFCLRTTIATFTAEAAVYELHTNNSWRQVAPHEVRSRWEMV